jgi:hypothetical protein
MAASVGVASNAKWKEKCERAIKLGQPKPKLIVPIKPATATIVVGLMVCSVVYHTTIAQRIGM